MAIEKAMTADRHVVVISEAGRRIVVRDALSGMFVRKRENLVHPLDQRSALMTEFGLIGEQGHLAACDRPFVMNLGVPELDEVWRRDGAPHWLIGSLGPRVSDAVTWQGRSGVGLFDLATGHSIWQASPGDDAAPISAFWDAATGRLGLLGIPKAPSDVYAFTMRELKTGREKTLRGSLWLPMEPRTRGTVNRLGLAPLLCRVGDWLPWPVRAGRGYNASYERRARIRLANLRTGVFDDAMARQCAGLDAEFSFDDIRSQDGCLILIGPREVRVFGPGGD